MIGLLRRLGEAFLDQALGRLAERLVDRVEAALDGAPEPRPQAPRLFCGCGGRLRSRGGTLECERCD